MNYNRKIARVGYVWLFVIVLVLSSVVHPLSSLASGEAVVVKRGQAAEIIANAAKAYNQGVKKADIIRGYGVNDANDLREHQVATKAEIAVMLNRGFGNLANPEGDSLRLGSFDLTLVNVPEWAQTDIDRLQCTGILTNDSTGVFDAALPMTYGELQQLIRRVWALEGSNTKDDFYATVNRQWLRQSQIPAGEASNSIMGEMTKETDRQLTVMIEQLAKERHQQGTKEQKIVDFYQSVLAVEDRNQQGIQPIQPYLDAYDQAKDLQQLLEADIQMYLQTGSSQLLQFAVGADPKDSGTNIVYHGGLSPSLEKYMYTDEYKDQAKAYEDYLASLLTLAGQDQLTAQKNASELLAFEAELSKVTLEPQEKYDIDKTYNMYSVKELDKLYGRSIRDMITEMEYQLPKRVLVMDKNLLEASASYFSDEHLSLLKMYAKAHLLMSTAEFLSDDFTKAGETFRKALYGTEGNKTDNEKAIQVTSSAFSDYLGELYVKQYFSDEAKQDVEQLVAQFIDIYKQKIANLDWMSKKTKKQAVGKLDTMTVKIGYPDVWPATLNDVSIKTYADGGSYFENVSNISRAIAEHNRNQQVLPVDREKWQIRVYEVNAYYNPLNNEIVFPAGILQAPFYDIQALLEDNLGGIGVVIAHEISHAFDDNGSKYDEHGNANDWWSKADKRNFADRCQEIVAFYDGIEILPGVESDGKLTLGENIADLGGISTSLELLKQQPNSDYRRFFEAYAKSWAATATKEVVTYLSKSDVHSNKKIRVNRSIVNFEEFYQSFDVQPGDGMYVPPAERVKLW